MHDLVSSLFTCGLGEGLVDNTGPRMSVLYWKDGELDKITPVIGAGEGRVVSMMMGDWGVWSVTLC